MNKIKMSIINMSYNNLDLVVRKLDIFHDQYQIIKVLKINQKRAIYNTLDTFSNEIKVLKFILKSCVTNEQLQVYDFYMKCNHINFCKINQIFECGIFIVIVMDYIEGNTMCKYFDNAHHRHNYYRILFDLIFALHHIHVNGLIHGDIKPNNIIIRTNGVPVLIDYDLGKFVDNGDQVSANIFGTKFFMPPELISHKKFSTKSDIWSLGMSLYICIMRNYVPNMSQCFASAISQTTADITHTPPVNTLKIIKPYKKKLKKHYGKLFVNILNIMLVENHKKRPSSKTLSHILYKSRYYNILYADNNGAISNASNIVNTRSIDNTNNLDEVQKQFIIYR